MEKAGWLEAGWLEPVGWIEAGWLEPVGWIEAGCFPEYLLHVADQDTQHPALTRTTPNIPSLFHSIVLSTLPCLVYLLPLP